MADSAQLIVHQKPYRANSLRSARADASGVPCTACYGVRCNYAGAKSYAAMDYDNQNTDSWNDRWGVDPLSTSIVPFFNKSLTPADRHWKRAYRRKDDTCGKMNDNCIEAMVFGNVLDAERQAALGLGYNLDMWIRQDPTHAATFPWGTQQWNGVSGTNSEFLSFQNDGGPIANTTRMTEQPQIRRASRTGTRNARQESPSTIQQAVIPTRTARQQPGSTGVQSRRTCKSSSFEAGSTATDALYRGNWVTIPFMAFTIYDFDHDGLKAGYGTCASKTEILTTRRLMAIFLPGREWT